MQFVKVTILLATLQGVLAAPAFGAPALGDVFVQRDGSKHIEELTGIARFVPDSPIRGVGETNDRREEWVFQREDDFADLRPGSSLADAARTIVANPDRYKPIKIERPPKINKRDTKWPTNYGLEEETA